jgi:hypothetical protein
MTPNPVEFDEAVERLGLMDSPPEERFDRITRLAREVFDVDYAVVNVVDSETVYTKSQPPETSFVHTPIDDSFCGEAVRQPEILEVPDGQADPLFADRAIVAEHGIRFYAGFPIRTEDGETVGTLCLLDKNPGHLTDEERATFERLGRWAEAEMRMDDPLTDEPTKAADASLAPAESTDELTSGEVRLAALAIPFGAVSGDRSAWQKIDDRIVVTLTDVMGKGEKAGAFARELVTALHARADLRPLDALIAIEEEASQRAHVYGDSFATLFHAVIDTATGRVDYVDAGHGLTLLLRPDGTSQRLSSHNLPLGLRPEGTEWEAGELTVEQGDLIVTVSDGALDAYDSTLDSLRQIGEELRRAHGPDAFFDGLSVRVSEHTVDDDVTAVVVSVL